MVKHIVTKTWLLGVLGLLAAVFLLLGSSKPHGVAAGGGGVAAAGTVAPLLSCPNVDGSMEGGTGGIRVSDILGVVHAFFHDWPATNYYPLYDLVDPYNSTNGTGGQQRVDDIIAVVHRFFQSCPLVDTQVAQAAIWGIQNVPVMENAAALHAMGYYEGSSDVPGQGVHYVNMGNWDGTFDPAAPEGLVYQNGRIAAQLYVVDGNSVTWGTHAAGPCPPTPCPGAEHGISLEGVVGGGPNCNPACSWDGLEGWHVHHYLCTVHVGTPSALALPGFTSDSACHTYSGGSEPHCTVPITTTPCYQWGSDIGWMGHLWNWLPNANQVPDGTGTNGRFADCFPDTEGWTAYNCPA